MAIVTSTERLLTGRRVLLVDDNPDVISLFGLVLRRAGAVVATASSARAALNELAHATYDVLITDLAMPDFDGIWLLKRLRTLTKPAVKAVMLVTAHGDEDIKQRALAAGADAYLTKPLLPNDLVRNVSRVFESMRSRGARRGGDRDAVS